VTSIVTRTGTPLVKKGDTVTAGQILVSGIVSVTDDAGEVAQNLYTCADADIMLRVELPYEEHLQQEYEYKFYTGRKKKKWIFKIFNFSAEIGINFGSYDEYDTVSDVKVMKLTDSFYLPFGTGTKECIEYKTQVRTYTEEEAQNKLKENFTDYLQDLLENKVQIISESVKIDRSGTEYVMSGTVTADVPAAGYTDISVPEIKGNEENNN
jgi:similar to stage IV sporulation protein